MDVRQLGQPTELRLPRFDGAVLDGWLGDMVEDEGLRREMLRQADRGLELPGVDQDIEGQPKALELGDPALEILAEHEAVVGLFLHDVADADELRVNGEARKIGFDAVGAQVDPADDTFYDGMLVRKTEEPVRFADHLTGLHGN